MTKPKKGVPVATEKEDGSLEVTIEGGMKAFMEECNRQEREALEAMKKMGGELFTKEFLESKEKELQAREKQVEEIEE